MKWHKTKHPGVRYREHPTRKNGVQKDKYFVIRYQHEGERTEEGLGWSTDNWTAEKAAYELALLKKAHRTGIGPQSLAEKRKIEEDRRQAEIAQEALKEKEQITFGEFFEDTYRPILEATKKPGSVKSEKILIKKWINPVLGDKPFKEIYPLHIERIRKNMLEATKSVSEGGKTKKIKQPKSARSIEYAFAVVRQVWNMARRDGLIDRESPTIQVKKPKFDNKRVRFLTYDEAGRLLDNLSARSQQLHDMGLLSLNTGMRAGEVFNLKWSSVHIEEGLIDVFDAKGGSRQAHMTQRVKMMFQSRDCGESPNSLVFKDHKGGRIKAISNSFGRAVDDLGLNAHTSDKRQRVLFHTLRHTYASWLVQQGEPLYTVQKLMGHATIAMTERYSHLAPDTFKRSVDNFERNIRAFEEKRLEEATAEDKTDQVVNLENHKR